MERLPKAVAGALLGAAGLFLTTSVLNALIDQGVPPVGAWMIVVLITTFIILIIETYGDNLKAIGFIRALYHRYKYEGIWLQNVQVLERPYAISVIYYDWNERKWIYRGTAFDKDMQPAARWKTYGIAFDNRKNRWIFRGMSQLIERAPGGHYHSSPPSEVHCMLKLPDFQRSTISDAYAIDLVAKDGRPHSFYIGLYRCRKDIVQSLLSEGSKYPKHIEEISFDLGGKIVQEHIDRAVLPPNAWEMFKSRL